MSNYEGVQEDLKKQMLDKLAEEMVEVSKEKPEATVEEVEEIAEARIIEDVELQNLTQDYEIVIPVSEILSVNFFDKRLYDRFLEKMPRLISLEKYMRAIEPRLSSFLSN